MMHSRDPYRSIDVGNANIYIKFLYVLCIVMNVTQITLSIMS